MPLPTQVFGFKHYKDYIRTWIDDSPQKGVKSSIAKHIGCQAAYVSQVLNGYNHFSLEQSHRLNSFFEHSKIESRFFLLLVQKDRAATQELKDFLQQDLQGILEVHLEQPNKTKLADEQILTYYSSWYYSAAHQALELPHINNKKDLIQYLHLPPKIIDEILSFLISSNLVVENLNTLNVGPTHISYEDKSSLKTQHLYNWRHQALQNIGKQNSNHQHTTKLLKISRKKMELMQNKIQKIIAQNTSDLSNNEEEQDIYCCSTDFFTIS